MAQIFQINGTSITRLNRPQWIDEPGDSQALDGVTPLARWRRLAVAADVLTMSEWNTLRALEGQRVSLVVPPYGDRNAANYQTYYGADFESLDGRHEGPVFMNVMAEFLVRV